MSENKEPNYFQKRLEHDPDNEVLKTLARMTADEDEPFVPFKLTEIEDEDPVKLGREGDCAVALEVLLELYPSGVPHRLTSDQNDFAHTFLMYKGRLMDVGGYTTIEEMQLRYKAPSHKSEPVDMEAVQHNFRGWRTSDEIKRLKAHFRQYILQHVGSKFPDPETQPNVEK